MGVITTKDGKTLLFVCEECGEELDPYEIEELSWNGQIKIRMNKHICHAYRHLAVRHWRPSPFSEDFNKELAYGNRCPRLTFNSLKLP